jgi:hypothetical protein
MRWKITCVMAAVLAVSACSAPHSSSAATKPAAVRTVTKPAAVRTVTKPAPAPRDTAKS